MMGEQSKNAYVLVYEKEIKAPIKLELNEINSLDIINHFGYK
jgi:hypothetical protein